MTMKYMRDISISHGRHICIAVILLFAQHGQNLTGVNGFMDKTRVWNAARKNNAELKQMIESICDVLNIELTDDNLKAIIEKVVPRTIFEYKKGTEIHFVNFHEIMYFNSNRKQVEIVFNDNRRDVFYGKLADIIELLPDNFNVIHKSYIINRDYIKKYRFDEVMMMNNEYIRISKPHRNLVFTQTTKNGSK